MRADDGIIQFAYIYQSASTVPQHLFSYKNITINLNKLSKIKPGEMILLVKILFLAFDP